MLYEEDSDCCHNACSGCCCPLSGCLPIPLFGLYGNTNPPIGSLSGWTVSRKSISVYCVEKGFSYSNSPAFSCGHSDSNIRYRYITLGTGYRQEGFKCTTLYHQQTPRNNDVYDATKGCEMERLHSLPQYDVCGKGCDKNRL